MKTKTNLLILQAMLPFMMLSYFVFFNLTQSFQAPLQRRFGVTTSGIQNLNSFYSIISVIVTMFMGVLLSRFGNGAVYLSISLVTLFGIYISCFSFIAENFWYFAIGRCIFAIGSASFLLVIVIIDKYFTGKTYSIVLAGFWIISRIVQSSTNYFLPKMFLSSRKLSNPFYTAAAVSSLQVFSALFYFYYFEEPSKPKEQILEEGEKRRSTSSIGKFFFNKEYAFDDNLSIVLADITNEKQQLSRLKKFTLKHLKTLNLKFWISSLTFMVSSSLVLTIGDTCTDLMQSRFGYHYSEAVKFFVIHLVIQTIMTPIFGFFMQKTGLKIVIVLLTAICSFGMVILLVILPSSPSWLCYLAIVLYGFAHAGISTSIYPCMTQAISEHSVSIGMSIFMILQNLMCTVVPFIIGKLARGRTPASYQNCLYLFLGMSIFGLGGAVAIFLYDLFGDRIFMRLESDEKFLRYRKMKNKEFIEISRKVVIIKANI